MIISDIDYLDSISETTAIDLNGGFQAMAMSGFEAYGFGEDSIVMSYVANLVNIDEDHAHAISNVHIIVAGDDAGHVSLSSMALASTAST